LRQNLFLFEYAFHFNVTADKRLRFSISAVYAGGLVFS